MKTGAARRVVGSPQAAAMRLNYRPADGESHTRAVRLGGKERLKDLVRLLRGQTHSSIADGHHNLLVFRSLRFDIELPRDRKSTRLNSSHGYISYAVFCLKKKNRNKSV